jgi:hypothetical protein
MQVIDMYFLEARHKLIEVAAFMDRVDRADGQEDFRMAAFRQAINVLSQPAPGKASDMLVVFSDPSTEPVEAAGGKSACGAWPGAKA